MRSEHSKLKLEYEHQSSVKSSILITVAIFACAALTFAQEAPSSTQIFSSDLVAWSGMQQPLPPEEHSGKQQTPDSASQQPASSSQNPGRTESQNADSTSPDQAPAATNFTGTVTREGDGFVLKVSETTTYKLDSERQIEQYDGQRVRVTGTLESGVNVIHVDRIEPLS